MRTIPAGLQAILDGNAASLASLWTITRTDGQVVRLTDADVDVAVGFDVYLSAAGITPSSLEVAGSLAVPNAEFRALIDSTAIDAEELRLGFFDYALVEVRVVDRTDTGAGTALLLSGRLGEVRLSEGRFSAELRGAADGLRTRIVQAYSPTCRADLGDARCRIPLLPAEVQRTAPYELGDFVRAVVFPAFADSRKYGNLIFRCTAAGITDSVAPTYPTTAGLSVTDGTCDFLAVEAWTRSGTVAIVDDEVTFRTSDIDGYSSGWFSLGALRFETGSNAGLVFEIKRYEVAGLVYKRWILFQRPPYAIQAGDRFYVVPGCDKRAVTCRVKFDNLVNFRGEPFVPGSDYLLDYPRSAT